MQRPHENLAVAYKGGAGGGWKERGKEKVCEGGWGGMGWKVKWRSVEQANLEGAD